MNTKVVGGLLAVLFVTSMVQTGAILKLQKVASVPQTQNVAIANDYQYDFNQEAAVGSVYNTVTPAPTPQGYRLSVHFNDDGTCVVIITSSAGTTYTPGETTYNSTGARTCRTDAAGVRTGSEGEPGHIDVSFVGNSLIVSSNSSILEAQFKLQILGYLSSSQAALTGKLDAPTQAALKKFQTTNKISATGTYGPQTKAALDETILSVKGSSFTGASFNFTR